MPTDHMMMDKEYSHVFKERSEFSQNQRRNKKGKLIKGNAMRKIMEEVDMKMKQIHTMKIKLVYTDHCYMTGENPVS